MRLPQELTDDLSLRFGALREIQAVSGGSICQTFRVAAEHELFFLKISSSAGADFFAVEAAGLALLRSAESGLRVPEVLGLGAGKAEPRWLAMEWLEPSRDGVGRGRELGQGLARLHRTTADSWGWDRPGFIGSLPQSNQPCPSWAEFWWEERLAPQLAMAEGRAGEAREWQALQGRLPEILGRSEEEGPSLLHGDLWSGNVLATVEGPALVDPACYHGHREVDLAMSELFGGFGREFYGGYDEVWPRSEGYEVRKLVYQLYYLLVHVNLFGQGYVAQTRDTLRQILKT